MNYNLSITDFTSANIVSIITSFRSFCPCFADITKYPDQYIWQQLLYPILIKISQKTKWYGESNQTFLNTTRIYNTEPQTIDCTDCNCNGTFVKECLGHKNVTSFISARIFVENEQGVNIYDIVDPENYYKNGSYSFDLKVKVLDSLGTLVSLYDLYCGCCESKMWYELTYTAGYNSVPDNLWSIICLMAKELDAFACKAGVSSSCTNSLEVPVNAKLKSYSVDGYNWTWEIPKEDGSKVLDSVFSNSNQLLIMSVFNYVPCSKPKFIC